MATLTASVQKRYYTIYIFEQKNFLIVLQFSDMRCKQDKSIFKVV